jgi:hypothetical protein
MYISNHSIHPLHSNLRRLKTNSYHCDSGGGGIIVTSNDMKKSVVIFAYCFSMLKVIRVCLQSTRERASGSSASGDSARGMEFLYYHLPCSSITMEFLYYHLISTRYGVRYGEVRTNIQCVFPVRVSC